MTLKTFLRTLLAAFQSRQSLLLENAALRHQIEVLRRNSTKPALRWRDRAFWDVLSCIWPGWRSTLYIVQPETVIRWHRQGFRFYWRWKSRPRRPGRPRISREIRNLIRELSLANPTWGAPRIHGELLKLGIDLHQDTVSSYMVRPQKPPSQTWRTFLANHTQDIASIDFFTVPTATFRVLYVFLVLDNARRRIPHFGEDFERRVRSLDLKQVLTAPRSPWQNPYVERVIGSIRRECLDHVIVFDERHLRRILRESIDYYHRDRTHLGLGKDCPEPRDVEPPEIGPITSRAILGGLHHRYYRDAA